MQLDIYLHININLNRSTIYELAHSAQNVQGNFGDDIVGGREQPGGGGAEYRQDMIQYDGHCVISGRHSTGHQQAYSKDYLETIYQWYLPG